VNTGKARILLLADTHLGFDFPFRPRVDRRRRGPDFFANFERALRPALAGEADLVVHGGDLFYRSKVPAALVEMALAPLVRVAESGVPVYIVPGNHERARLPMHLWTGHPNIHIFHEPVTFTLVTGGLDIALAGFPFSRQIGQAFSDLVDKTGYRRVPAAIHLLCLHQSVEGSKVGPSDFTFRPGPDVIRGTDIPGDFDAVLAGHIHRWQLLERDLNGRPLPAPVVYPGSIERTSFAERNEEKGYCLIDIRPGGDNTCPKLDVTFVPLPARPMVSAILDAAGLDVEGLQDKIGAHLSALDPDAVVRLKLVNGADEMITAISAAGLRDLAPSTMNVTLAYDQPESRL